MQSGYKTITPIQLSNALWALAAGKISPAALRVYFACFVLVAVREAATRYRKSRRELPKKLSRYRLREFERLTGLSPRAIIGSLRHLREAGLLSYSEGEINVRKEPIDGSEALLERLSCSRSPKRPVPVPRSMLRFLAQNRKVALTQAIVAYIVRGLSLARTGGEVSSKGTVKASWIAETFQLSERAVQYARSELVRLGWIEKDTQSRQRKLNRDGAYFIINLDWAFTEELRPGRTVDNSATAMTNSNQSAPNFAPLPPEKCIHFAPPYKNKKTSYEDKNQKTQTSEPPGVSKREGEQKPNLRNVIPDDLRNLRRLETLYEQAVQARWIQPSEAMALNFVAAAVRARDVGHDPARVFVTLVRKRLWQHITQAQEDYARVSLARWREDNPERFRLVKCAA